MSQKPFVTVVSAVYNVARYLPDFFESLRAQTLDHSEIEVILVDDGSKDNSKNLCLDFVSQWDGPSQLVTQANGGQSSARNLGMDHAHGEWLNFCDPDDWLGSDYFANMKNRADVAATSGGMLPTVLSSSLLRVVEETGETEDNHTLSYKFSAGDRTVDLRTKPNYVQLSASSALFNREAVETHKIRFNVKLKRRFEDASFTSRVLIYSEAPLVGIVGSAHYFYRVRKDGTSTIQNSLRLESTYLSVPKHGYLDLYCHAESHLGEIPVWLQNVVLYDLFWMFKDSQREPVRSLVWSQNTLDEVLRLLARVSTKTSRAAIQGFDLMYVSPWIREVFELLGQKQGRYSRRLRVGSIDKARQLIPLRMIYLKELPLTTFSVAGRLAQARYTGDRGYELLGHTIAFERTFWLSSTGIIRADVDGSPAELVDEHDYQSPTKYKYRVSQIKANLEQSLGDVPKKFRIVPGSLTREIARSTMSLLLRLRKSLSPHQLRLLWESLLVNNPIVRNRYLHSWVVQDRDTDANDNGEVFYKWLRKERPGTKAYFVIRKGVPDWNRLRKEGIKTVPFGGFRWKLLMMLADNVISSHIDRYITSPLPREDYGKPQWGFTFLQHGVTKGDISGWLNHKDVRLLVTATESEYKYISGAGPFKFSPKEVRLAGFPRHDELLKKASLVDSSQQRLLIVAPTWRNYLTGEVLGWTNQRSHNPEFHKSAYAKHFSELLSSERLREISVSRDVDIAFMPHPNMQQYLDEFDVPDYVRLIRYSEVNIREVLAHARLMVTDYSSIAFDMGFLYKPVVYDHFDGDSYFSGPHIERQGYFSYERDGFGPVARTIEQVLDGIDSALSDDYGDIYYRRAQNTFPVRDGRNCTRVYDAIVEASKPVRKRDRLKTAELDSWGETSQGVQPITR